MKSRPEVPYTKPTIHKGDTVWYVEFTFWNNATSKMERVRRTHDLNRKKNSPNLKAKKDNFKQLLEFYVEELEAGYDPFDDVKNAEVKKSRVALSLTEARNLYYESPSDLRGNTKGVYFSNLDRFISVIGGDKKITDVTGSDVKLALAKLEKDSRNGKWRNTTFNNKRVSIGTFFEFLKSGKLLKENPMQDIKLKTKQTTESHEVFTPEDLKIFLNWMEENDTLGASFCKMIYYTCIRPNELRLLQVKHINLKEGIITVPENIAKNKTIGYVNIDKGARTILEKLDIENRDKDSHLFSYTYLEGLKAYEAGKREKIYSRNAMSRKVTRALEALELTGKNYTLYSFKHTSNVNKYKAGWSIAEICAANRHKSLVQTETYLKELLKFAPVNKEVPSID